jgi:hypothetical protein
LEKLEPPIVSAVVTKKSSTVSGPATLIAMALSKVATVSSTNAALITQRGCTNEFHLALE